MVHWRRTPAAALVLVLLLPIIAGSATPVASAVQPTYTGFAVADDPLNHVFDQDPSDLQGWFDGQELAIGADGWGFFFSSGPDPLHLGDYLDLHDPLGNSWAPAMTVNHGFGCNLGYQGDFNIVQLPVTKPDGTLVSFAADFRYRCIRPEGDPLPHQWTQGSIRLAAATPPSVIPVLKSLSFPDTTVGHTSDTTLTLTAIGSGTSTIDGVTVRRGSGPVDVRHRQRSLLGSDPGSGRLLRCRCPLRAERLDPAFGVRHRRRRWSGVRASDPGIGHRPLADPRRAARSSASTVTRASGWGVDGSSTTRTSRSACRCRQTRPVSISPPSSAGCCSVRPTGAISRSGITTTRTPRRTTTASCPCRSSAMAATATTARSMSCRRRFATSTGRC